MADNYLEKKMEEHRARLNSPVRKRSASPSITGVFPCRNILVAAYGAAWEEAVVAALRSAGHRVAFLNPAGAPLAQATGSRCYPFSSDRLDDAVADLKNHWGSLDVLVTPAEDNEISVENLTDGCCGKINRTDPRGALLLTHPAATAILSLTTLTCD